ncbi:MAG: hypothetical protein V1874_11230, partial [Spirochaetota bacterium]
IFIMLTMCLLVSGSSLFAAGKLLTVPEGGKVVSESSDLEVYVYENMKLADVENFYKNVFKDYPHASKQTVDDPKTMLKFNDWGNKPWHAVTAVDKGKDGLEISVMKDSWTWIIGTLVIRFVGVFIVLACLMIVMYISGIFFKEKKQAA